ncbi:hypothetical protein G5I_03556 [Acromyrmex echinatior]|uniref:Uncharacterized protein n=1 Tax=Acromyrmex echinatior TaxID=103372 RepID=F4WDA3_ACREC|nr:hypothetical protein G5I_03556 [Acromyrmex echinatior]
MEEEVGRLEAAILKLFYTIDLTESVYSGVGKLTYPKYCAIINTRAYSLEVCGLQHILELRLVDERRIPNEWRTRVSSRGNNKTSEQQQKNLSYSLDTITRLAIRQRSSACVNPFKASRAASVRGSIAEEGLRGSECTCAVNLWKCKRYLEIIHVQAPPRRDRYSARCWKMPLFLLREVPRRRGKRGKNPFDLPDTSPPASVYDCVSVIGSLCTEKNVWLD